jgi:hypothetical protein
VADMPPRYGASQMPRGVPFGKSMRLIFPSAKNPIA